MNLLTFSLIAGFGVFSISSLSAGIVDASAGLDLGLSGAVYNARIFDEFAHFPELADFGWLTPGAAMSNMMAPVGQFTGFDDNGIAIDSRNLIPLRTTSVTVVDRNGRSIFKTDSRGTSLDGNLSVQNGSLTIGGSSVLTAASPPLTSPQWRKEFVPRGNVSG